MNLPSVSIIIPNWNGADLLEAYIPSILKAQAQYPEETELIVVDDASTDASVALLKEKFPDVKTIMHDSNQGFGKACGSGARAARHPVLILLNSDVKVYPDFIAPLVQPFEKYDVFAASPLILDQTGNPSDVTICTPYFRRGKIRYKHPPLDCLLQDTISLPHPWQTLFPLGGAFAVRRDRFLALNGFDDLFEPFYYEDTDLGFRAWRRGWSCVVIPESKVIHMHAGVIARSFKRFKIKSISKRNRLLYLWKNLTSPGMLCQHLFFQFLRLIYAPLRLNGMVLVATALAITKIPEARRRRIKEKEAVIFSEKKIFETIRTANAANQAALEINARASYEEKTTNQANGVHH